MRSIWIVSVGLALLCSAQPTSATDTVVAEFKGSGMKNTRPFTVKDQWELRWTSTAGINLTVSTVEKKLIGVANTSTPGPGDSFQPKGCICYIEVMGTGDWTVTVVQLP